jgi:hypothetical protein
VDFRVRFIIWYYCSFGPYNWGKDEEEDEEEEEDDDEEG